MKSRLNLLVFTWATCFAAATIAAETAIVVDGQATAAVFVPARLMDDADANPEPPSVWRSLKAENNRRRLRESVQDFVAIIARISGAWLPIVSGPPSADDSRIAILVGELADERFGPPQQSFAYGQGLRITVRKKVIGLSGESDLATSYALYTLLDQIGCRWYMPSELGEVLPRKKTVSFDQQDLSTGPATIYRGLWYCDNEFARRNRLGGMLLAAGHNLEQTVPKSFRDEHPEIRATIDGQPHPRKVKWTHPLVAQAIADACIAAAERDPHLKTWSLSPDDGVGWDESDDTRFDAGDFDPAIDAVSKTDRLMVLANRVAEQVGQRFPEIKFGLLAYADYTRPPIRENVHANVVPQIAPITFSRAHPMTDPGEPNNAALRTLVKGWGSAAPATSYYFYGYNLAEVSSPNPMITKWSIDIPYVYEHGSCRYWQPETITNFETSLHAHHLGIRLAWDRQQDPAAIMSALHTQFYGHAARQMAAYWSHIDQVWVGTPEYSGCGFGHLRRWTTSQLQRARQLLDDGAAACRTAAESARVQLASDSLAGFEQFMELRRDLADGRFRGLSAEAESYRQRMINLGDRYAPQFAFTKMAWTRNRTLNVVYFDAFYKSTYEDAARIAAEHAILTRAPLRKWRYRADPDSVGESANWFTRTLDDTDWQTTDSALETWSTLGLHSFMGSVWYRANVTLGDVPAGKRVYLWLSATDGRVKVFVNGRHVPYRDSQDKSFDSFNGFCKPVSFDITDMVEASSTNQISLLCSREFLNELGSGGLLGPAVIYREK